jgi:hypothetical protein
MSYNKRAHLQTNIEAVRIAFTLDREKRGATEAEQAVLRQYSGFGGLKCILNPAQTESDRAYWTKSESDLFPMVSELHGLIRENSRDEQEYRRYFNSLKNSILTAFYTPPEIIKSISDTLKENGIAPVRFLEPSAGNGAFADAFRQTFPQNETVCFEKDLLTGKILSRLHPDDKVHIRGFEEIENHPGHQFDVVASNIPFGDTAVFDTAFSKSNDPARRQASRSVHNYFFLKGTDTLREGGLLAFITSQGVMNSLGNEPVRKWLMDNTNLVSAVRLPNNLMSDNAGTEVGSDLIILQKNSNKTSLTPEEQEFIKCRALSNGMTINNCFQDFSRVVQTKSFVDKDLYGKPGMIHLYEGGATDMAADLKKMLSEDISNNLNHDLYRKNAVQIRPQYRPTEQDWREMGEIMAQAEKEQRRQEYRDPLPEDYTGRLTREDMDEIDAAVDAVRKGKWDEFVAARPYINSERQREEPEKSTHELDREDNSPGLDDLDPFWQTVEEHWFPDNKKFWAKEEESVAKTQAVQPPVNVEQQPVISLYDLFGFSEEERKQLNTTGRNKKKSAPKQGKPVQLNLFSQPQMQPETVRHNTNTDNSRTHVVYPVFDARKEELEQQRRELEKPRPYSGVLQKHHKQGSLVTEQNGQTGFLKERYRDDAIFKSLELNPLQEQKAKLYIETRDTYHSLYNYEAKERKENADLRQSLNLHYDTFVKRYGHLNDRKNLECYPNFRISFVVLNLR